jgi:hypothetical protein
MPLIATGLLTGAASAAAGHTRPPSARDIAGALHWQSGRTCRDLIDACVDENGNALVQLPEYIVSKLRCRPLWRERATCSFVSQIEGEKPSRQYCTATLERRRLAYGDVIWEFASSRRSGRPRLSPDPILTCN